MTSSTAALGIDQFRHTPFYEENVYHLCKKLINDGAAGEGSDLFVVFISNKKKQMLYSCFYPKLSRRFLGNKAINLGTHPQRLEFSRLIDSYQDLRILRWLIPLWHQKSSQRVEGIMLWDYHVICVQKKIDNSAHLVWDLDSSLQFPYSLASYVSESIKPSIQLFSEFQRFFRIVHAPIFLRMFASDRRHMKDSEGYWMYEPPQYDPIVAEDGAVHNLNEYIEMSASNVVKSIGPELVDAVQTQKLGVLVGETQFEDFFSLMS